MHVGQASASYLFFLYICKLSISRQFHYPDESVRKPGYSGGDGRTKKQEIIGLVTK